MVEVLFAAQAQTGRRLGGAPANPGPTALGRELRTASKMPNRLGESREEMRRGSLRDSSPPSVDFCLGTWSEIAELRRLSVRT